MKHADTTQWADYVRGLVNDETRSEMSAHLDSGCKRCAGTVAFLGRVGELPAADAASEPPAGVVRSVKAYFSLQEGRSRSATLSELAMRLVADSSLEPAALGVRHGDAQARCLTYESSEHALELQVTAERHDKALRLVGELLLEGERPVAQAPAFLLSAGHVVSHTSTDDLGAFVLAADPETDNQLCLVLEDGTTVTVGLELLTAH